jgi:ATP-dependent helicase HrpB
MRPEVLRQLIEPEEMVRLQARLKLLREQQPSLEIPPVDEAGIRERIAALCYGRLSLNEVLEAAGGESVAAALAGEHQAQLERFVPTNITLPRGRRVKVNYEDGKPPWIESRLQDFFGMARGPAILDGRVPLTVHLLAPNYRAVQVTSDLAGFWKRDYPELRRELGRRYPRHFWPEDPLNPGPEPARGRRS